MAPILHRLKGPAMLGPFQAGSSMAAEHRTDICIIGAGPVLMLPTGAEGFTNHQWGAGPMFAVPNV